MNKDQIISYIKNPQLLDQHSVAGIKEILNDYPAFQTGHILLLKNLFSINDIRYDKTLAKVAAYAGNRELLYNFVIIGSQNSNQQTASVTEEPQALTEAIVEPASEPSLQITPNEQPVEVEDAEPEIFAKASDMVEVDTEAEPEMVETPVAQPVFEIKKREYFDIPSVSSDYFGNLSEVVNPAAEKVNGIHSFTGWLDIMNKAASSITSDDEYVSPPAAGTWDIIENFIKEKPHFSVQEQNRTHAPVKNVDLSARSVTESEEFMTETLARIYLKQKNYTKAIQIFKKLSLKYPEKSIYFAGQIEYVQQLIHNEKQ